jgi:hypothetical protein
MLKDLFEPLLGPKTHSSYVRLLVVLGCSALSVSKAHRETHFDQLDCVLILSIKMILSDFESFMKVVVLYV